MIVVKEWYGKRVDGRCYFTYKGWFLFGAIPLLIIREGRKQ